MMDKSKWPQGPWTDEPDEETFEHAGLACRIIRHSRSGGLCGYVRVSEAHPLYGKGYSDAVPDSMRKSAKAALQSPLGKRSVFTILTLDPPEAPSIDILFDVHGSLSFAGELHGVEGHWFGFDCAHSGDLKPDYEYSFGDDCEYRDIEYVRAECRSLAEQLVAVAAQQEK